MPEPTSTVDTLNKWGVGARGENIVLLAFQRELTKRDALLLAAWLVALAEDRPGEFGMILNAVLAT